MWSYDLVVMSLDVVGTMTRQGIYTTSLFPRGSGELKCLLADSAHLVHLSAIPGGPWQRVVPG